MNKLPFNACDYRCDRCLETASCEVFKKLEDRVRGREGEDPADLLKELRSNFRETEEMIKQKAREFGIDIDDIAGVTRVENVREQIERKTRDPLFKRAQQFMLDTGKLLKAADPDINQKEREFFEDIDWHHSMVPAKLFRALSWRTGEDVDVAVDGKNSAAVAMKSLTICIMSLEHLAGIHASLADEAQRLASFAKELKNDIKIRFQIGKGA